MTWVFSTIMERNNARTQRKIVTQAQIFLRHILMLEVRLLAGLVLGRFLLLVDNYQFYFQWNQCRFNTNNLVLLTLLLTLCLRCSICISCRYLQMSYFIIGIFCGKTLAAALLHACVLCNTSAFISFYQMQ